MTTELKIIWDTHNQYIIRDVHEKLHEKVRNYMLNNYFIPHRLFAQLNFQEDPVVNDEYLKYVDHILLDQCSIVALDKYSNIHAVALLKCMTKEWRSWTAFKICIDECKLTDIIELKYRMIDQFENEHPEEPFDSLNLFEYYIEEELKHDYEFTGKFFNAIYETARHFKMMCVTFLALSQTEQQECYEQGYEPLSRAIYSIYTLNNRRPFALLRDIDEMEAVLFVVDVDVLVPFPDMKVRGIDEIEPPKLEQVKHSVGTVSLPRRSVSIVA